LPLIATWHEGDAVRGGGSLASYCVLIEG